MVSTQARYLQLLLSILFLLLLMAPDCDKSASKGNAVKLKSNSFEHESMIPADYTCEGKDISPHLSWDRFPSNTQSLALIVDDPDAPNGVFVHWVAWNIDPNAKELAENIKSDSPAFSQGTNSASQVGYMGPCPPSGTHRYYFKLYALDTKLSLPPSTTKDKLLNAMTGHIVGEAHIMGKYKKNK